MAEIVTRQDAEALIQEQLIRSINQEGIQESLMLKLMRKLPNMTSKQTRIPVLNMLPMAYWVNGDTGQKQTTSQNWDNVYLTAEELAVIVPIPEAVIADASFDIMGEIQPRIKEAMGRCIDSAILFGADRPASWPADIITRARQAGNNVAPGGSPNYYDLIMGDGGLIAKVESSGKMVNAAISAMSVRAKLRGIKTTDGLPIFKADMQGSTPYALDGAPMYFPTNGAFDESVAQLIVGDFSQAVYSIRQDITVKILDQGIIQDPDGSIKYNLAQQDMIALRVVFRMGWALPNPATRLDGDRTTCPFAYLEPTKAATTYKLTVTVNDDEESPLEGAIVDVNGARKKTGAEGTAEFELFPGKYTAKATMKGYKAATAEYEIKAAAETGTVALAKA